MCVLNLTLPMHIESSITHSSFNNCESTHFSLFVCSNLFWIQNMVLGNNFCIWPICINLIQHVLVTQSERLYLPFDISALRQKAGNIYQSSGQTMLICVDEINTGTPVTWRHISYSSKQLPDFNLDFEDNNRTNNLLYCWFSSSWSLVVEIRFNQTDLTVHCKFTRSQILEMNYYFVQSVSSQFANRRFSRLNLDPHFL